MRLEGGTGSGGERSLRGRAGWIWLSASDAKKSIVVVLGLE